MAGRKPKVSDREILRAVALSPSPVASATMVSEQVDLSRQGADNRLKTLVEEGFLSTRDVGGARIYWLTEEGRQKLTEPDE